MVCRREGGREGGKKEEVLCPHFFVFLDLICIFYFLESSFIKYSPIPPSLPPSLPPVPAAANGLMTVLFNIEGEIGNKKEYYVDALLLKDAKDYKS